jgi:poly(A) polymerase
VLYKLKEQGYFAYLVGGGVRDLLLGREPKDFDIATDATPNEIKKIFRNCRLIGKRFRLAHIHFHNEIIEVATFRSSSADEPPAEVAAGNEVKAGVGDAVATQKPASHEGEPAQPGPPATATVTAPRPRPPRMLKTEDGMILRDNVFGTPEEDALRRDFTVNALFYNIADFSVIDYVGGMRDLRSGFIRIIGDPVVRFTEDPVRMVRAARFAAMLGFEIEEGTKNALLELKDRVALASPSRMYEEVLKLFLLGEGENLQLLRKTALRRHLPVTNWCRHEQRISACWISSPRVSRRTRAVGRPAQPHILRARGPTSRKRPRSSSRRALRRWRPRPGRWPWSSWSRRSGCRY